MLQYSQKLRINNAEGEKDEVIIMTKKAQKMVETYKERLDMTVFSYKQCFVTFDDALIELKKEQEMFENLKTSMYYYGMLSENEHTELVHTPHTLRDEAYNKLLDIKYNR